MTMAEAISANQDGCSIFDVAAKVNLARLSPFCKSLVPSLETLRRDLAGLFPGELAKILTSITELLGKDELVIGTTGTTDFPAVDLLNRLLGRLGDLTSTRDNPESLCSEIVWTPEAKSYFTLEMKSEHQLRIELAELVPAYISADGDYLRDVASQQATAGGPDQTWSRARYILCGLFPELHGSAADRVMLWNYDERIHDLKLAGLLRPSFKIPGPYHVRSGEDHSDLQDIASCDIESLLENWTFTWRIPKNANDCWFLIRCSRLHLPMEQLKDNIMLVEMPDVCTGGENTSSLTVSYMEQKWDGLFLSAKWHTIYDLNGNYANLAAGSVQRSRTPLAAVGWIIRNAPVPHEKEQDLHQFEYEQELLNINSELETALEQHTVTNSILSNHLRTYERHRSMAEKNAVRTDLFSRRHQQFTRQDEVIEFEHRDELDYRALPLYLTFSEAREDCEKVQNDLRVSVANSIQSVISVVSATSNYARAEDAYTQIQAKKSQHVLGNTEDQWGRRLASQWCEHLSVHQGDASHGTLMRTADRIPSEEQALFVYHDGSSNLATRTAGRSLQIFMEDLPQFCEKIRQQQARKCLYRIQEVLDLISNELVGGEDKEDDDASDEADESAERNIQDERARTIQNALQKFWSAVEAAVQRSTT